MSTSQPKTTRGKGVLEPFLSRLRADKANQLIPAAARSGRILDIGCGSYPYFLTHTDFAEKYAIDQLPLKLEGTGIHWHQTDLNANPTLPFDDSYFDVVTLLAVVEHLNPQGLPRLLAEIRRALKPGGRVILTTPAGWTDGLLHLMARLSLVSAEEIDEHAYAYTLPTLAWCFGAAGFAMDKMRLGTFELGVNLWATAER